MYSSRARRASLTATHLPDRSLRGLCTGRCCSELSVQHYGCLSSASSPTRSLLYPQASQRPSSPIRPPPSSSTLNPQCGYVLPPHWPPGVLDSSNQHSLAPARRLRLTCSSSDATRVCLPATRNRRRARLVLCAARARRKRMIHSGPSEATRGEGDDGSTTETTRTKGDDKRSTNQSIAQRAERRRDAAHCSAAPTPWLIPAYTLTARSSRAAAAHSHCAEPADRVNPPAACWTLTAYGKTPSAAAAAAAVIADAHPCPRLPIDIDIRGDTW